MKRLFFCIGMLLMILSCGQPKEDLSGKVLELCQFIPDHGLRAGAADYLTPEFYNAYAEAFDAPVADYGEIGENEWLWYFVSGNGDYELAYKVQSVKRISKDLASAIVSTYENAPEGEGHVVMIKKVDGKWLLDDIDGKKDECISYIKKMRGKYQTGEIVEYLQSDEYLKEFVPDFNGRVKEFYEKYGTE